MGPTSMIRRHISGVPSGVLFTTRDLLTYGGRSAVDNAISRMVTRGTIHRVARGVFVRSPMVVSKLSALEIARAKAGAFAKEIASFGDDEGEFDFVRMNQGRKKARFRFSVSGSSSQFQSVVGVIVLCQASARKMRLLDLAPGKLIRTLWRKGADLRKEETLGMYNKLDRPESDVLRRLVGLMPDWMARKFPFYGDRRWYGIPGPFCISKDDIEMRKPWVDIEFDGGDEQSYKEKWTAIDNLQSELTSEVTRPGFSKFLQPPGSENRESGTWVEHSPYRSPYSSFLEIRACPIHFLECDRHMRS